MPLRTADLPDAVIGTLPRAGELVDEGALQAPAVRGLLEAGIARGGEGADHLADGVGLTLLHGRVADPDRS